MRSYSQPLTISYAFPAVNMGGDANVTRLIAVPILTNLRKPGGKVKGALLHNITEDFTGDVSDAFIHVGISGDTDKYYRSVTLDETVDIGETLWLNNAATDAVAIENGRTDITVTFVAGATTETGIGDVLIVIDWF